MAFAIRVLRLLEKSSSIQLTVADEYALDLDVIDADSIRTIVEHRADKPVQLTSFDDRRLGLRRAAERRGTMNRAETN